ncbi:MAG TPA: hypothetical protein VND68_13455 [Chloroflexia bacterium]|nr:hypothetical protein [Chloroflexia bacterium]
MFTILQKLKPGAADRIREHVATVDAETGFDPIGTIHELRIVFFDNDTRWIFATTFDGDWDKYIEDFASLGPERFERLFGECEDWPGVNNPDLLKAFFARHQVPAAFFYTANPDSTVNRLKKAERVLNAWEEMLDASG